MLGNLHHKQLPQCRASRRCSVEAGVEGPELRSPPRLLTGGCGDDRARALLCGQAAGGDLVSGVLASVLRTFLAAGRVAPGPE